MRQLSVYRLASYFLHRKLDRSKFPRPHATGFTCLGCCHRRVFRASDARANCSAFYANRLLINRIEILYNADRDRLAASVDAASDGGRPKLLRPSAKC